MTGALIFSRPLDGLRRTAARLHGRAGELWRAYPRETLGFGLFGVIAAAAVAGGAYSMPEAAAQPAPPAPPPLLIRQLPPAQALQVNAAIPVAQGPNPAAAPFVFKGGNAARTQALECLASTIYYEAGQEPLDGQRAVAQVVLNRVRHAAFPASVCGVVYQGSTRPTGCQFTFTCDGSLYRGADAAGWRRAYQVAQAALSGYVYAPVGWATHYHANYVVPYWASTLAKNAIVGAHIFYRWAGGWGRPTAFAQRYAGKEADARALRTAALAVERVVTGPANIAEAIEQIPGAEPLKLAPSMRGDKRVGVRFNLAARQASDQAAPVEYTKKFESSDNLKWSLSSDVVATDEKPLGKAPEAAPAQGGSATVSAER